MFGLDLANIKLQKLHPDAIIPSYANGDEKEGDIGLDLCSVENLTIEPGKVKLVRTGWAMEITNHDFALKIYPRSGLALKNSITVLNSPGLIDFNYRDDIGVILINHGDEPFEVKKGMRIAQLVVVKVLRVPVDCLLVVDELSEVSSRGKAGFGSTGV